MRRDLVLTLQKAAMRLPRNLRSNRWFVIIGHRVFVYSRAESRRLPVKSALDSESPTHFTHRGYRPLLSLAKPQPFPNGKETAILLTDLGRFGNAIREIVSAVAAAERSELGHVFLHGDNLLARHSDLANPGIFTTASGVQVWVDTIPSGPPPFRRLITWKGFPRTLGNTHASAAWGFSRELFGVDSAKNPETNSVAIHLRGGDVFGDRDTRNYGQPPLSYYSLVLDHLNPDRLTIVHQDNRNPVLAPLIEECMARGIDYRLQSGDLRSDITALAHANVLVAGRGTFLPGVAGLSAHLKKVFYFEDKFIVTPPREGFEVWRVSDRHGAYRSTVLSGAWMNTVDQRELMISYPKENLVLSDETRVT